METMVITGASSGIGEALAHRAANAGWRVIGTGRNRTSLATLEASHENIDTLCFDVSDAQETAAALGDVRAQTYVLNAGICEYVDVDNWDATLFQRVFDANLFGLVNCIEAVLPNLRAGDQIVVVDSLARLLPFSRCQALVQVKQPLSTWPAHSPST